MMESGNELERRLEAALGHFRPALEDLLDKEGKMVRPTDWAIHLGVHGSFLPNDIHRHQPLHLDDAYDPSAATILQCSAALRSAADRQTQEGQEEDADVADIRLAAGLKALQGARRLDRLGKWRYAIRAYLEGADDFRRCAEVYQRCCSHETNGKTALLAALAHKANAICLRRADACSVRVPGTAHSLLSQLRHSDMANLAWSCAEACFSTAYDQRLAAAVTRASAKVTETRKQKEEREAMDEALTTMVGPAVSCHDEDVESFLKFFSEARILMRC